MFQPYKFNTDNGAEPIAGQQLPNPMVQCAAIVHTHKHGKRLVELDPFPYFNVTKCRLALNGEEALLGTTDLCHHIPCPK